MPKSFDNLCHPFAFVYEQTANIKPFSDFWIWVEATKIEEREGRAGQLARGICLPEQLHRLSQLYDAQERPGTGGSEPSSRAKSSVRSAGPQSCPGATPLWKRAGVSLSHGRPEYQRSGLRSYSGGVGPVLNPTQRYIQSVKVHLELRLPGTEDSAHAAQPVPVFHSTPHRLSMCRPSE